MIRMNVANGRNVFNRRNEHQERPTNRLKPLESKALKQTNAQNIRALQQLAGDSAVKTIRAPLTVQCARRTIRMIIGFLLRLAGHHTYGVLVGFW